MGNIEPVYLRAKQISEMFCISVPTLYRYLNNDPEFPRPLKPSTKTTLWNVKEIENYFKNKSVV